MTVVNASARRVDGFRHDVAIRSHTVTVDEAPADGGGDAGPTPQELLAAALASCTAVTIEMYAQRKGWDVDGLRVDCSYTPAERGHPTRFELVLGLPATLEPDQADRLAAIATRCPIHRALEGEVAFDERIELI